MIESSSSGPEEKPQPQGAAVAGAKQGKKRKVRSVWISFVGRVVAQFVGSAATVGLGLLLLHKYDKVSQGGSAGKAAAAAAAVSAPASVASSPTHDYLSLAVLPLLNFSSGDRDQYVADSMTEVLTADLAQIRWLHVVSRTSATNSALPKQPATAIAAALGVHYILEGSVAQANGRIRITAQLIDGVRDEHVWAHRYDRAGQDVFAAQEDVAAEIVRDLKLELDQEEGDASVAPTSSR